MIYELKHISYNWKVMIAAAFLIALVVAAFLVCYVMYFLFGFSSAFGVGVSSPRSLGYDLAAVVDAFPLPNYIIGVASAALLILFLGMLGYMALAIFVYNVIVVRLLGGLKLGIRQGTPVEL